jgi:hypothetical protein
VQTNATNPADVAALTNAAAMNLWGVSSANGTILDELVKIGKEENCPNGTKKKFKLRVSASVDPLTNKQWHIIKPIGDTVHFSGVASESKAEPLRKSFADVYDSNRFEGSPTYSDWLFTWELKLPVAKKQTQVQNLTR